MDNVSPEAQSAQHKLAALRNYKLDHAFDEMFAGKGQLRELYAPLLEHFAAMPQDEVQRRKQAADLSFLNQGITFTVYGREEGTEKIFPYDLLPRIITSAEWAKVERGLTQRITALNLFLKDIYNEGRILKDGIVPRELVYSCPQFRRQMSGLQVPRNVYIAVCGTDLIRLQDGDLRRPRRQSARSVRRQLHADQPSRHEAHLPPTLPQLQRQARSSSTRSSCSAPCARSRPKAAPSRTSFSSRPASSTPRTLSTPISLARWASSSSKAAISSSTTTSATCALPSGLRRVDVIYRRVDDDFIDPLNFRSDSILGVAGLFNAYRAGNVTLANAFGTGVADDKALYAYVPRHHQATTSAKTPVLPNIEDLISAPSKRIASYVLANLDKLVVKAVGESGGYGMLIGTQSTPEGARAVFAEKIKANPRNYIAQPTISFSRAPCLIGDEFEPRHVDLRPYVLYGDKVTIVPGGLTRVALKRGSLVVNSSQGGGSKDTWVLS